MCVWHFASIRDYAIAIKIKTNAIKCCRGGRERMRGLPRAKQKRAKGNRASVWRREIRLPKNCNENEYR